MLPSNEEISKIEKTYLSKHRQLSFSSPWFTSQSLTKASSFPINLYVFRNHVSNARGSPRGMLMPSPRGCDKIANAPPPGLTTWANALRLPGGMGTAGIDWCIKRRFSRTCGKMVKGSDVAYARNTEIELFRLYSYTPHATSGPLLVNLNSRFHHRPPPIRHKTNYWSRVTIDCSQSPIFPLDRRCRSLSPTGRHLGL